MSDTLATYRKKRNFALTPEPERGGKQQPNARQFVVQKHWASRLHYDFRLELDGAMKSWAVPKGPSLDPADKRMAVQVEDHPIAYNSFEGQIPAGQYGAGRVIIWDRGTWEPVGDAAKDYAAGKIKFELHGHKLQGRWMLVRMHGNHEKQPPWLLIKEHDAAARTGGGDIVDIAPDSVVAIEATAGKTTASKAPRTRAKRERHEGTKVYEQAAAVPLPASLRPQLATRVEHVPADAHDWLWELKFDGYRVLARKQSKRVQLFTRNGHDWTAKMPAFAAAVASLPVEDAWLDGEVVALNAANEPDFQALQNAFDGGNTGKLVYYLFDLPFANGADLRGLPTVERRERLQHLLTKSKSTHVRFSESFDADATQLLGSACKLGFEGLIGKRRQSSYRSTRSDDWIKLKCKQRQEFVVGGFTEPKGSRSGFGALLLGVYAEDGALLYCGNVGSGFSEATLASLRRKMGTLEQSASPFADGPTTRPQPHWLKPKLVAEVEFAGWTDDGKLRHAVFRGLRSDKPAAGITREIAMAVQGITSDSSAHEAIAGSSAKPKSKTFANASAKAQAGSPAEPARRSVASRGAPGKSSISGIDISHPERVVDATTGIDKLEVARHYAQVAPLMMEHLRNRPTSLVRAPDGIAGELFFQKHLEIHEMQGVVLLDPSLDSGHPPLIAIAEPQGLVAAAQMNVIEFHTWNARKDRIERPDRMTFDLDPGEGVAWERVQEAARLVRTLLAELGLPAFLKTSGGKGLHVVVPIKRLHDWDTVKGFSQAIVQHLAATIPARFVAKSGPRNRVGKIFVDYLRNGRGATTVAAWSARARPGMGVSVPVSWAELGKLRDGDHWTIRSIDARLRTGNAPWQDYDASSVSIAAAMRALGWTVDA